MVGAILTTVAGSTWLLALPNQIRGHATNPYIGILLFIILASNRPDLIDPAVLRPGRIDRKIKVARPGRMEAGEILDVYLTADLPVDPVFLATHKLAVHYPHFR